MSMDAIIDTSAKATLGPWLADTNDMVTLRFGDDYCHPTFTYPFYGEEQVLAGYKNPAVTLRYASASMRCHLSSQFEKKSADAVLGNNIVKPLLEYLPRDLLHDNAAFQRVLEEDVNFTPPGRKIGSYSVGDADFDLFSCSAQTPGFKTFYDRIKILCMFYIEAATPVDVSDPRWNFVLAFSRATPHAFVGMTSLYSFFQYPQLTRRRISQVLVLPNWQRQGHATHMYTRIMELARSARDVAQCVIEDPSEAFDALRDVADLVELLTPREGKAGVDQIGEIWPPSHNKATPNGDHGNGSVAFLKEGDKIPFLLQVVSWPLSPPQERTTQELCSYPVKLAKLRALVDTTKMHPRQAERVYEMLVLHAMGNRASLRYRQMVKARIWRFNRDAVEALPSRAERIEKLHETYMGVLEEYRERLRIALAKVKVKDSS